MVSVYFAISARARERQWDTVRHQPPDIAALVPAATIPQGSRATYAAYHAKRAVLIRWLLAHLPLLNVSRVRTIPAEASVLYVWGTLPLFSPRPWIVELDNPYALTYYHRWSFLLYRPLIRWWLSRARAVVCMSEACRATLHELLGELTVPVRVSYPFVPYRAALPTRVPANGVRFAFVALDFVLKGGPELLEAWRRLASPHATLHIVSAVPARFREQYGEVRGIVWHEPLPREVVLRDIYPMVDVFVYPTLYDSFGVVLLEALSYGLAIIATNVYATPEVVVQDRNGLLLNHPVLHPRSVAGRMIVDPVSMHAATFVRRYRTADMFYESLCVELVDALQKALDSAIVTTWREGSRALYTERFDATAWQDRMRAIFRA